MKVWKTKSGEKITAKEFGKRFKEGINNITPEQKLANDIRATIITFAGYVVGLISLIVFLDQFPNGWLVYGLILIFLGSAYSSAMKLLMLIQQKRFFRKTDSDSILISDLLEGLDRKKEVSNGFSRSI